MHSIPCLKLVVLIVMNGCDRIVSFVTVGGSSVSVLVLTECCLLTSSRPLHSVSSGGSAFHFDPHLLCLSNQASSAHQHTAHRLHSWFMVLLHWKATLYGSLLAWPLYQPTCSLKHCPPYSKLHWRGDFKLL